ncbi:STAS domain-containing protein [Streptomyces sp. NPDC058701]|uniref:STAS domain-containing protein n=1 Tax=Streptomyces sp. NPDC058701 TaxID=3346608 RepID=UPI003665CA40
MNPIPGPLRLVRTDTGTDTTVRIELHGDFDHQNADTLLDAVTEALAEAGRTHDLHVNCGGVATVDSSGLSVLLMVRRRTDAAGVRLHLHNRPAQLDRMLRVTGTLDRLTGPHTDSRPATSAVEGRAGGTDDSMTLRSGGPDTT